MLAVAPAVAGVEGAVFVLVVGEVDGGTTPRLEVTSAMPGSLETLAQGRALGQDKLKVSIKCYYKEMQVSY